MLPKMIQCIGRPNCKTYKKSTQHIAPQTTISFKMKHI